MKEFQKFSTSNVKYLLVYFEEEKSYEIICTNSMLLNSNFDYEDVEVKDKISIKPDAIGTLIAKSPYMKDMEIFKRRTELKLQKDTEIDLDASLSFLNHSLDTTNVAEFDAGSDGGSTLTNDSQVLEDRGARIQLQQNTSVSSLNSSVMEDTPQMSSTESLR